ncbi:unnamed protein product [Arabis nemorensis]|uniref:Uncharacterized protein n=1 Tax=Arabis nemorensis TaxID=586526 RepID=A0A565CD56_9BRAS|nr:unnamed protein product [Arabis nemorensis]
MARISQRMKKISECDSSERNKWTSVFLSEKICKSNLSCSIAFFKAARTASASATKAEATRVITSESANVIVSSEFEVIYHHPKPQLSDFESQAPSMKQENPVECVCADCQDLASKIALRRTSLGVYLISSKISLFLAVHKNQNIQVNR